jgi:hypothetical protein
MTEAGTGKDDEKCQRIREIWDAGLEPKIEVLIDLDDRQLAYDAEQALIKSTHGLTNKTKKRKELNLWSELGVILLLGREEQIKRLSRIVVGYKREDIQHIPGWPRLWDCALRMLARLHGTEALKPAH